jgi:hypothetical protein
MAMQNINLYDSSLRVQRDWLNAEWSATLLSATLLVVALGSAWARWEAGRLAAPARETADALQAQQTAIQELARQVDTLRPNPMLLADVSNAQATLEQRQAALQLLRAGGLGEPQGHAAALQAFARQSIEGLWLTGVVLDKRDMALRGRAMSPALIPAYVGRLNQEAALHGRSFRTLNILRPVDEAAAASAPATAARTLPTPLAPFVEFALSGAGGASVNAKDANK